MIHALSFLKIDIILSIIKYLALLYIKNDLAYFYIRIALLSLFYVIIFTSCRNLAYL